MPQIPSGWRDLMYDPNWRCWIAKKESDIAALNGNVWGAPEYLLFEDYAAFMANVDRDEVFSQAQLDGTVSVAVEAYLTDYPMHKGDYVRAPKVQARGNTVESLALAGWDPLASLVQPDGDPRRTETPGGRVDAEPPDVSQWRLQPLGFDLGTIGSGGAQTVDPGAIHYVGTPSTNDRLAAVESKIDRILVLLDSLGAKR